MEDSPFEINQYQGISHSVEFFFFCTVLTMEAMLLSLNGMNGWGEDHDKPNAEAWNEQNNRKLSAQRFSLDSVQWYEQQTKAIVNVSMKWRFIQG